MFSGAKRRAKDKGLPFNLVPEDIVIPDFCPIFGLELKLGNAHSGPADFSATLDRIVPKLGYVKGNVIVISSKANRIKNNATLEELQILLDFYKNYTVETTEE